MVFSGVIVNALAILFGGLLGGFFRRIPNSLKETVIQAIGLIVVLIGVQMSLESDFFVRIMLCIILGGILGESLQLEQKLYIVVGKIEKRFKRNSNNDLTESFIVPTIFYLAGAMSIIGALDSGLKNDHTLLYTKAMMDGVSAFFFMITLGYGIIFAAPVVLVVEGMIVLLSFKLGTIIPLFWLDMLLIQINGIGGVLVFAVGLNLLEITRIRIINLLPSIIILILIEYFLYIIK